MVKKDNKDYDEIVRIYNELGHKAASDFITSTYGLKSPWNIIQKLKHSKGYTYDEVLKKYIKLGKSQDEPIFLNLEELSHTNIPMQKQTTLPNYYNENLLEGTINDLIQDNFHELSKFIKLKQSVHNITINMTAIKEAGYDVVIV